MSVMSSRMHRVAAHAVGYLFACVGFSLSVLSILFNLLSPKPTPSSEDASKMLTATLIKRQTRRLHFSIQKVNRETTIPRSNSGNSKTTVTSVPPTPVQHTEDPLPRSLKRKPTVITFVTEMDTNSVLPPRKAKSMPSERVFVHSDYDEFNRSFFLSHFIPLRTKRSKLYRCTSPSHLSSPHLMSRSPLPLSHQVKLQEHGPVRKRRSNPLCKEPRTPASSTPRRSASCPLVKKNSMEKKKSQPLRTQPYEAPYFFPPPVVNPSRNRMT